MYCVCTPDFTWYYNANSISSGDHLSELVRSSSQAFELTIMLNPGAE
jgi:hypothetical protein